MDQVITQLNSLRSEFDSMEIDKIPYYQFVWLGIMSYHFKPIYRKSIRIYRDPSSADVFCLRVRQDQYLHNDSGWKKWYDMNYDKPCMKDPHLCEMYLNEKAQERVEKRLTFLVGSRYESGSVLSKLTGHGVDHASLLRNQILRKAGLQRIMSENCRIN